MTRATLTEAEAAFVRWERVGRFASVGVDGMPHVVPVCPVLDDDVIVFTTEATAKVRNLRANPRCAMVFDAYVEDWDLLRQVQVRGRARIVEDGPDWDRAKALLDAKYPQYEPITPIVSGESVMVFLSVERVTSDGF